MIHRWAAIAAVPAFAFLVLVAPTLSTRVAVLLHAVGVIGMLGVSAIYHSGRLSPRAVRAFKVIDHTTILFAIAGTYIAVTVLALDGRSQSRMLWLVGVVTSLGIVIRLVWLHAPYPVVAGVYVVVGWSALAGTSGFVRGTTNGELALIVAGGLLYTIGGVIYALHRPVLRPATFGFHELFHALVVAGAATHFAAVALMLARS